MTSPVDTSVKYFHSGMLDAPVLGASAGSLLAVLDACLVNGFGLKTTTSATVVSGVATLNITGGHAFEKDTVIIVSGATPSSLNGEQKVTSKTSGSVSFNTAESDVTPTGTITVKLAPAGWEKPFSKTNVNTYKPLDITSTGNILRVDDTNSYNGRITAFTAMTDVDTGDDQYPSNSQLSGGAYWSKSSGGTNIQWRVVASGKHLFFIVRPNPASNYDYHTFHFGDMVSVREGSNYDCVLQGAAVDASTGTLYDSDFLYKTSNAESLGVFSPKSYTGVGGAIRLGRSFTSLGVTPANNSYSGKVIENRYPNPVDGGIHLVPLNLFEVAAQAVRGHVAGLYCIPQNVPAGQLDNGSVIEGSLSGVSKKFLCLGGSAPWYNYAVAAIDITGPWG